MLAVKQDRADTVTADDTAMLELNVPSTSLRAAANAEDMAAQILRAIRDGHQVRVHLASVEIMTPSFANTLIMTLLASVPLDQLRCACEFVDRTPSVVETMNRAAERYLRGVRLSAQLPPAVCA